MGFTSITTGVLTRSRRHCKLFFQLSSHTLLITQSITPVDSSPNGLFAQRGNGIQKRSLYFQPTRSPKSVTWPLGHAFKRASPCMNPCSFSVSTPSHNRVSMISLANISPATVNPVPPAVVNGWRNTPAFVREPEPSQVRNFQRRSPSADHTESEGEIERFIGMVLSHCGHRTILLIH